MEYARIGSEEKFMVLENKKRYTTADIEALPEGERAELIDGELFMMAAPTLTHQLLLGKLFRQIDAYIEKNKGNCTAVFAPFGVYIKNNIHDFVEPDIVVICDKEKLDDKGCHGAPDWVIEIVSPSSKKMDYERKRALYREAGVREYWIVDPKERIVTVYCFERGEEAVTYSCSEQIKVGIYEDLWITLPTINTE